MTVKTDDLILDLLVQTDPKGIVELESAVGIVLRHMSARYMLTGKDHTGTSCHIYVRNEAWFTDGARPRPWHSVPTLTGYEDSSSLPQIDGDRYFRAIAAYGQFIFPGGLQRGKLTGKCITAHG